MADIEALTRRSNDLHSRYQYSFAGKPRVTRRLGEMDQIISGTVALLADIEKEGGAGELATSVKDRLTMYRNERGEIERAQRAGGNLRKVTLLGSRANFWFSVYGRHFAGHSRATRDVALLDDLVAMLDEISGELGQLVQSSERELVKQHLEVIERNAALYASERDAILASRRDVPAEELTSALAGLANSQFETYRTQFANKARLSRRPALLERLVDTLDACRTGMSGLLGTESAETNQKNIDIVDQRLEAYRAESEAIRKARETASVFELIDALGQAANVVMESYASHFAGQDRATRDAGLLSSMIDELLEIERQMWSIGKVYDNATNAQNTVIVHDTLTVYLREYDQIREVQKN
ncbi:MAG: hypothetical protein H6698_06615 [Myxococcales bacterium]|nr:hypothetical protein [Myxococcales bacterium]MCB9533980.1 hypothetical protein [Myxococcales bacterium]